MVLAAPDALGYSPDQQLCVIVVSAPCSRSVGSVLDLGSAMPKMACHDACACAPAVLAVETAVGGGGVVAAAGFGNPKASTPPSEAHEKWASCVLEGSKLALRR